MFCAARRRRENEKRTIRLNGLRERERERARARRRSCRRRQQQQEQQQQHHHQPERSTTRVALTRFHTAPREKTVLDLSITFVSCVCAADDQYTCEFQHFEQQRSAARHVGESVGGLSGHITMTIEEEAAALLYGGQSPRYRFLEAHNHPRATPLRGTLGEPQI